MTRDDAAPEASRDEPESAVDLDSTVAPDPCCHPVVDDRGGVVDFRPGQRGGFSDVPVVRAEPSGLGCEDLECGQAVDSHVLEPLKAFDLRQGRVRSFATPDLVQNGGRGPAGIRLDEAPESVEGAGPSEVAERRGVEDDQGHLRPIDLAPQGVEGDLPL